MNAAEKWRKEHMALQSFNPVQGYLGERTWPWTDERVAEFAASETARADRAEQDLENKECPSCKDWKSAYLSSNHARHLAEADLHRKDAEIQRLTKLLSDMCIL